MTSKDIKDLRQGDWKGFIGFSIKAEDTEFNEQIHEAFKKFCQVETKNDFTLGLKTLLEYFQSDMKYEMIWDVLKSVDERVSILEKPAKTEIDEDEGAF